MARRQADHAGRRDFFVQFTQATQSTAFGLLPARHQGGKNRRPRGHLRVRRARQSRTAANHRSAYRPAKALVGRNRCQRQTAQYRRDHARAAARQRALSHQGFFRRPQHRLRTREESLVARFERQCRNQQFRRAAIPLLPRHHRRPRSVQGRHRRLAKREQRQELGDGLRFPCGVRQTRPLEEFPIRNTGVMQAFAFNIRRPKFQDPRLRLAFNYAFDFEEMNKQIFFNQYKRITSYFEGTELAATGLPSGRELELLESVRDKVPPEVFKKPYTNPVNGNPEQIRANLREALHLLKEAGYEVRDQQLVNVKTGEPYSVELLAADPSFERVFLFFKPSLQRLGITVAVRTVDEAQYENRLRNWDFDMITFAWAQSLTPGNEQRGFWGSQAADQPGSLNMIGIKNPAVDAMIDQIIFAKNRADLEAATHALDRILLWNHYVVPQWTYGKVRTARWDRFGHPDPMPKYGRAAFPTVWWWDAARATKTSGQ